MAVTRTWDTPVTVELDWHEQPRPLERRQEAWFLLGASVLVAAGLALVFVAKTQDFAEQQQRLNHGELINLNQLTSIAELQPVVQTMEGTSGREVAAQRMLDFLAQRQPVSNVGSLARLRATIPKLPPLAKIKALLIVRTPSEFRDTYLLWTCLYLASFWIVHFLWRWRQFSGDAAILPALHLLTGIGLILMVSLRDPLRDTLEFEKFSLGVMAGCATLLLPLLKPFQYRNFKHWVYSPLLAGFALFLALLAFGSGPTGSDAKVNLGRFQPVEAVKILLVFFMAGYFATNWERLRDLHEKQLVPRALRWLEVPRTSHTLPVMCAVACALMLFFALKDMGPALVIGFLFLSMFAVARRRAGLALFGVALLVGGVTLGYHLGTPHTVANRVAMWLSPWNNNVHGGDQLAHSLWAFATGGPWGSGPGWGDPSVIPAGHTDLVLPAIAEEWGIPGVLAIAALFALLIHRAFRIALRAPDDYAMFLSAGLGTLVALEMLLISGGALGAIPLSGVVSPFLSSGNTAMLANFFIFAILLGISNQSARLESNHEGVEPPFRSPIRILAAVLAFCAGALLVRAFTVEVLHDRELLKQNALVYTQDGVKRPQRNPRLNLLAASIPRGNIYDRNGVLLATSSWAELEKHRSEYTRLGVSIDQACSRLDSRLYPFGGATIHLLGDLRTGENFHATNASLIEHDSNPRLQGFSSYDDLAPVVRYRHQQGNPALQQLLNRNRDVRSTIDIRLQLKATEILRSHLEPEGKKGALVIINPADGDVLALVSWPQPNRGAEAKPDELLDRARYGEYPPGSTFKLVTAMAALRLNPKAMQQKYTCQGLGDGRVGTVIAGWRRPIRDDIGDHAHGALDMANAIAVSCNAYFAQLGVHNVGAQALHDTAGLLGIPAGDVKDIRKMMPFAAYGQGPVLTTPFKMARVSATIAAGGSMPAGRWVLDPSDSARAASVPVLATDSARFLQKAMRAVVTSGTARTPLANLDIPVAGKTGTAQLDSGEPHSWFAGYAPFDAPPAKQVAFAIVVEHGGYGAKFAAPIGRELVEATQRLGIISSSISIDTRDRDSGDRR